MVTSTLGSKCAAHSSRTGQPCQRWSIKGGNVCIMHGGSAPQVRQAAKMRLLEAADPAAAELVRLALHAESEQVRLGAIKELFARTGLGEADRLEVTELPSRELVRLWIESLPNDVANSV